MIRCEYPDGISLSDMVTARYERRAHVRMLVDSLDDVRIQSHRKTFTVHKTEVNTEEDLLIMLRLKGYKAEITQGTRKKCKSKNLSM